MSKVNVYRRKSTSVNRVTTALSNTEQTSVTNIISNFFTYFKAKHT